jgi:heme-degrading monooxygenase HmoA
MRVRLDVEHFWITVHRGCAGADALKEACTTASATAWYRVNEIAELLLAGCLGAESVRDVGGLGITVAYFTDEPAIQAWKQNSEHLVAQRLGKERAISK